MNSPLNYLPRKCILVALLACVVVRATAQNGAPPDLLSYQGYLTDANGAALALAAPANYPVTFRVFSTPTGGSALWSEDQVVTVDQGYFSVVLGEGTQVGNEFHGPLSSILASSTASDRYIQMTVSIDGSPTTLLPRLRLLPSAYAFLATRALNVEDSALSANVALRTGGNTFTGDQIFNDRVGIGTASPAVSLHVNGPIRSESSLQSVGASTVYNPNNQGNENANVHLSWLNNLPRIRVGGTGAGGGNGFDIQTSGDRSLLRMAHDGTVTASAFVGDGSGLTNLPRPSALDASDGNPTSALVVDASGRIGIGTDTPSVSLDVRGQIRAAGGLGGGTGYTFNGVGDSDSGMFSDADGRLKFLTQGTQRMQIMENGNASLGTAEHPNGNNLQIGSLFDSADGYGLVVARQAYGAHVQVNRNLGEGGIGLLVFNAGYGDENTSLLMVRNNSKGAGGVPVQTALDVRAHAGASSYVGINQEATTSYELKVNGRVAGVGTYVNASDRRYKKDIQEMTNAMSLIERLRGVSFDWRREEFPSITFDQGRQYGFIAQEAREVLPEIVSEDTDGYLSLGYTQVVPILVEAIKEQQREIAAREARVEDLEQRLEALETRDGVRDARLAALEALLQEHLNPVQQAALGQGNPVTKP